MANRIENTFKFVFEESISDDDLVVINMVAMFSENSSKVIRVSFLLVNEVKFTVNV